jgi:hypothetical protein
MAAGDPGALRYPGMKRHREQDRGWTAPGGAADPEG